jgi:hypothetical protein
MLLASPRKNGESECTCKRGDSQADDYPVVADDDGTSTGFSAGMSRVRSR